MKRPLERLLKGPFGGPAFIRPVHTLCGMTRNTAIDIEMLVGFNLKIKTKISSFFGFRIAAEVRIVWYDREPPEFTGPLPDVTTASSRDRRTGDCDR